MLSSASAQEDEGEAAGASKAPVFEFRIDILLMDPLVIPDTTGGPVWELKSVAGRQIIQLPLSLKEPSEVDYLLKESPYQIQTARFLAWYIPTPNQIAASEKGVAGGAPDSTSGDITSLWDDVKLSRSEREIMERRGSGYSETQQYDPYTGELVSGLPPGAPRTARELIFTPEGKVKWEFERGVPGEVRSGDEPYKLKLRSDRLRAMEPVRPNPKRQANEDARVFSARQRKDNDGYRFNVRKYRTLQEEVRNLDEEFETETPPLFWAVYEYSIALKDVTILGDNEGAGPWSISVDNLKILRNLASGLTSRTTTPDHPLSYQQYQRVAEMTELIRDQHPYTHRIVAKTLLSAGWTKRSKIDDPLYNLLKTLVASPDKVTRNQLIYNLVTAELPTEATASLLKHAATVDPSGATKLASLRSRLKVDLGTGGNNSSRRATASDITKAAQSVNEMLADPEGPDAGLAIRELLEASKGVDDATEALITGVTFTGLTPPRTDSAIAAVLRASDRFPEVTAGWIDRQMLASNDPALAKRTLELLARAGEPTKVLGPVANALASLVSKPTDSSEDAQGGGLDLAFTEGISLDSPNHAIFRQLNASDPELRKLAWKAIDQFRLTGDAAGQVNPGSQTDANKDEPSPLVTIVAAGLGQQPTPETLVPFIVRQRATRDANASLVSVVLFGDAAASRRAARALLGSDRKLTTSLDYFTVDQRQQFANRLYEVLGDGPEPVSGLMREVKDDKPGRAARWFLNQITEGQLPSAAEWYTAYEGEPSLTNIGADKDIELASGAVAALTAAAGGDRLMQLQMIDRLKQMRFRSQKTIADGWADAKQEIYRARLAKSAGDYRLVMRVIEPKSDQADANQSPANPFEGDPNQDPAAAQPVNERVVLGVIKFVANGQTIAFEGITVALTVPQSELAIRIANVSELKTLPPKELQELPLEQVTDPLDLRLQPDGVWTGQIKLPEGKKRFELSMEPMFVATPTKPAAQPKPRS